MIIIIYSLCISNKYYLISDNKIIYAWQGHAHLSAPMVIPGGNNFNHQTLHHQQSVPVKLYILKKDNVKYYKK